MAKVKSFTMLYAIGAAFRSFNGTATVQITVAENPDAKTGVRVYRQPTSEWVETLLESCGISADDLAEMQDGEKLPLDEPVELEEGVTFSVKVPPLVQYFTPAGGTETNRVVDNVSGVLTRGSGLTVDDLVRQTMRRRLTARDDAGNYQYGVPKRKSILADLAKYWIGTDDRDTRDALDAYVTELDKQGED